MRRTKRLIGIMLSLTMILGTMGISVKATEVGDGAGIAAETGHEQSSMLS